MEFKNRIKSLRNIHGLTASELAKKIGKSESDIGMWEIGKNKPNADTLIELSKIFNCTTDYLLGLSDTPKVNTDAEITELIKSDMTKFDIAYMPRTTESELLSLLEHLREQHSRAITASHSSRSQPHNQAATANVRELERRMTDIVRILSCWG